MIGKSPRWRAQIVIARAAFRVVGGHLMFTRSILLWLYALSLFVAAPALADQGFVPLPGTASAPKDLEIQVRRYEGSTNGQLTVAIRNPTTRAVKFEAGGLYFVPEQNANDAPQRGSGLERHHWANTLGGWSRQTPSRKTLIDSGTSGSVGIAIRCGHWNFCALLRANGRTKTAFKC